MRKTIEEIQKLVPAEAGTLRPIPGIINIVASEDGKLWSLTGKPTKLTADGKTQQLARVQYENGGWAYRPVSSLIALAFLGTPPEGRIHVLYKDGDFTNNKPENLEYCTRSESFRQRQVGMGEASGLARLTEMDIKAIRYLHGIGYSAREIAENYEVNTNHIYDILNQKVWRHVP